MEYVFLVGSLLTLLLFYPIYYNFYTEDTIKCQVIIYGFIRINLNINQFAKYFANRDKKNDNDEFSVIEIVENYKKYLSTKPFIIDFLKSSTIKHFYWYTALPIENVIGLSLLPIYSIAQGIVSEIILENFKKVEDVDIDTKYNYVDNNIFIYLDCIIKTNLGKIIIVSFKYIRKIPLMLKRVS